MTPLLPFPFPGCRLFALILLGLAAGCTQPGFGPSATPQTSAAQKMAELKLDLRRNPESGETLRKIGDMEAAAGNWNRSMGAYREALLVAPGDREARLGYGEAQLALGDYAGALNSARQAGGDDIRVTLLQSGALAGMNRLAEARRVLETASAANPRNLDLRSNIAIVAALGADPQAYAIARAAAFAPDATHAHRRNLVLVGGMTGQDRPAREDGLQLGLDAQEITDILAVGRRARSQGMSAFGVLAGA